MKFLIFNTRIIHTHCLQTMTIYIYIYIISRGSNNQHKLHLYGSCPLPFWRKSNKAWYYHEVLLGHTGFVSMMLWPQNHAWFYNLYQMKAFVVGAAIVFAVTVLCILPEYSAWTRCEIRGIFKRSTTDWNSEFSFS